MATYNKFQQFVEDLGAGVHDLQAAGDTVKVYLTNETPDAAADSVKADLAEISAGNGYTAGGEDIQQDYSQTGGTATMTGVDVVWTASGGTVGPFRYAVLYNDTATDDPLLCWWDYGSPITLADGETFTIDFGSAVITIA